MDVGKVLIVVGGIVLLVGVLIQVGVPLGRLPGDIRFSSGNVTVYAPLVTGIILSIVFTVLLNVLFRSR